MAASSSSTPASSINSNNRQVSSLGEILEMIEIQSIIVVLLVLLRLQTSLAYAYRLRIGIGYIYSCCRSTFHSPKCIISYLNDVYAVIYIFHSYIIWPGINCIIGYISY